MQEFRKGKSFKFIIVGTVIIIPNIMGLWTNLKYDFLPLEIRTYYNWLCEGMIVLGVILVLWGVVLKIKNR